MLKTSDFDYELPDDRIAIKPAGERGSSKLLIYRNGEVNHGSFDQIAKFLPPQSLLVLNDSRVIPARLYFSNQTGAQIEIFLLEPFNTDHASALSATSSVTWKCLIGNRKRWKSGSIITSDLNQNGLTAEWQDIENDIVRFHWKNETSFGEILEKAGSVPLPPYLRRASTEEDRVRYQTVYATNPGAVAAPTAGLHFNKNLLNQLVQSGHEIKYLTLHVSAGTFLPVKSEDALQHKMHEERVIIDRSFIYQMSGNQQTMIAVGTTSMRALESLYWFGVQVLNGKDPVDTPITQDMPYQILGKLPSRQEVFGVILSYMDERGLEQLPLATSIFIRPGYRFGLCEGLITNFHQPRSTLLMLVCAFIGEDWKRVYHAALNGDYRFLSYGDSSLLLPGTRVSK